MGKFVVGGPAVVRQNAPGMRAQYQTQSVRLGIPTLKSHLSFLHYHRILLDTSHYGYVSRARGTSLSHP